MPALPVRTALVSLAVLASSLAVAGPAEAATYTSTGVRCTKVGTTGNDVLVGTSRRDVLCGRGGNDVLKGAGGDDVLDGGPGADTLYGGWGADQVLGGGGNDRLWLGSGNDTAVAGGGDDRIYGQTGHDTVNGGWGNDVAAGGSGNDTLRGEQGLDTVSGEAGHDTLRGADGSDRLFGGDGDDDLDGGTSSDLIDGQAGTNWCTTDPSDRANACKYDEHAPDVTQMVLGVGTQPWSSAVTVDVSAADQSVRLRMRVVDDTGVVWTAPGSRFGYWQPRMISGTVRDGWWSSRLDIPRFTQPGTYSVSGQATDRVGRSIPHDRPGMVQIHVVNSALDREQPVVVDTSVTPERGDWPLDVRSDGASLTVRARITDDLAGPDRVLVCGMFRQDGDWVRDMNGCGSLSRISGTERDGTYLGSLYVPKGSQTGTWNLSLNINGDLWMGPGAFAANGGDRGSDSYIKPLPGNSVFDVIGLSHAAPPELRSVRVSPTSIDTLPRDAQVDVDVHLVDPDGHGISRQDVALHSVERAGSQPAVSVHQRVATTLLSGTAADGVWRVSLRVPQGTPPGTYYLEVTATDQAHSRTWLSPSAPADAWSWTPRMSGEQLGGASGEVTVVRSTG